MANTKCDRFYDKRSNGLTSTWAGETWWCNPPYGTELHEWTHKAATETSSGVMLLPARTDTAWWHEDILPYADEVRFIRGRLYFLDPAAEKPWAAPFPSALAIFRSRARLPLMSTLQLSKKERGVRAR